MVRAPAKMEKRDYVSNIYLTQQVDDDRDGYSHDDEVDEDHQQHNKENNKLNKDLEEDLTSRKGHPDVSSISKHSH